jgi:hypothetical protein
LFTVIAHAAVEKDISFGIHDADIHAACMQVYSATIFMMCSVKMHIRPPVKVCNGCSVAPCPRASPKFTILQEALNIVN